MTMVVSRDHNATMQTTPLTDWSHKYARRSKGLTHEKVSRYGRQILEVLASLAESSLSEIVCTVLYLLQLCRG